MSGISRQTKELLASVSTATIQTQLFRRGLRNTFLYGLKPLNRDAASFVAEAFTLRYIPAREDLDVVEAFLDPDHPQRKAIESVGPGQALVFDSRSDGFAASAGNILATRLMRRGGEALITDGSVRDSPEIATMQLPVYCRSVSATTNLVLHHAVDMQVPIGCAGVPIYPGDVLVGDLEGVVVIPRALAEEIAVPAAEQEDLEAFIHRRIDDGAPLRGTYPPSEETMALYRSERER